MLNKNIQNQCVPQDKHLWQTISPKQKPPLNKHQNKSLFKPLKGFWVLKNKTSQKCQQAPPKMPQADLWTPVFSTLFPPLRWQVRHERSTSPRSELTAFGGQDFRSFAGLAADGFGDVKWEMVGENLSVLKGAWPNYVFFWGGWLQPYYSRFEQFLGCSLGRGFWPTACPQVIFSRFLNPKGPSTSWEGV